MKPWLVKAQFLKNDEEGILTEGTSSNRQLWI